MAPQSLCICVQTHTSGIFVVYNRSHTHMRPSSCMNILQQHKNNGWRVWAWNWHAKGKLWYWCYTNHNMSKTMDCNERCLYMFYRPYVLFSSGEIRLQFLATFAHYNYLSIHGRLSPNTIMQVFMHIYPFIQAYMYFRVCLVKIVECLPSPQSLPTTGFARPTTANLALGRTRTSLVVWNIARNLMILR